MAPDAVHDVQFLKGEVGVDFAYTLCLEVAILLTAKQLRQAQEAQDKPKTAHNKPKTGARQPMTSPRLAHHSLRFLQMLKSGHVKSLNVLRLIRKTFQDGAAQE